MNFFLNPFWISPALFPFLLVSFLILPISALNNSTQKPDPDEWYKL